MAKIGLKNLRYALINPETGFYGENKLFAYAVSSSFEPTIAEGVLYADNMKIEEVSEVTGGTLTLTVDDDIPGTFSEILGQYYNETTGLLKMNASDNAPFVGVGEIVTGVKNNVKYFEVRFYKKLKFKPSLPQGATSTDSTNYSTTEVEGSLFIPDDGNYIIKRRFTTLEEAQAALANMFYTTAITPPTLAQPDSSSDPITTSATIAGNTLEYSITSANGSTTTTGTAESLGTTTAIPAPTGDWQNGMKVKARNSDAQTGQNSVWSAVLTISIS
jgi:hypothetical protein